MQGPSERENGDDPGAACRPGGDRHAAAEFCRPLAHRAVADPGEIAARQTAAVVRYGERHAGRVDRQADGAVGGAGVPHDVVQRLGGDPVERDLEGGGQGSGASTVRVKPSPSSR